jgi:sulfur carrier protein ThiS
MLLATTSHLTLERSLTLAHLMTSIQAQTTQLVVLYEGIPVRLWKLLKLVTLEECVVAGLLLCRTRLLRAI